MALRQGSYLLWSFQTTRRLLFRGETIKRPWVKMRTVDLKLSLEPLETFGFYLAKKMFLFARTHIRLSKNPLRLYGKNQIISSDFSRFKQIFLNSSSTPFVTKLHSILSSKPGHKPRQAEYPMPDPKKPWMGHEPRTAPEKPLVPSDMSYEDQIRELEYFDQQDNNHKQYATEYTPRYRDFY